MWRPGCDLPLAKDHRGATESLPWSSKGFAGEAASVDKRGPAFTETRHLGAVTYSYV